MYNKTHSRNIKLKTLHHQTKNMSLFVQFPKKQKVYENDLFGVYLIKWIT